MKYPEQANPLGQKAEEWVWGTCGGRGEGQRRGVMANRAGRILAGVLAVFYNPNCGKSCRTL